MSGMVSKFWQQKRIENLSFDRGPTRVQSYIEAAMKTVCNSVYSCAIFTSDEHLSLLHDKLDNLCNL